MKEEENIKTYRLTIRGKVQGVWYRASAKDQALRLGLTGKIWNEYDGDVGAYVQGTLDKILAFIEWCKEGPPLAKVDEVIEEEMHDAEDIYQTFDIAKKR
jgi:acylphosphatase